MIESSEKPLTEKESLDLIARMINKARDTCHDTGVSAMMWGGVIAICSLVRLSELQFGYELPAYHYCHYPPGIDIAERKAEKKSKNLR